MKMDIQRAIDFVYENGDMLEKARLEGILGRKKPAVDVVQKIIHMQNEDGGFPYNMEKGKASTISDTTVALMWLNDLGLLQSDMGKKTISYIISVQRESGSWDENPHILAYNPPIWMVPGDEKTIVYATAYSAFWLGVAGYRNEIHFHKAYEFLIKCQNKTGKFVGFLHNTWIATSVIGMVDGWESKRVRRAIEFLDSVESSEWIASQISWLLWCFAIADVPKDDSFVRKMRDLLSKGQRADGSFASEDGDVFAVGATIESIKVMSAYMNEGLK